MQIATHSRAQSPCVVRTSALAQADLGTFPAQRDRRPVHRVTKRTQFRPRRCTPVGLPISPRVRPPTKGVTAERTQNGRNQLPINILRGICHPRPRRDGRKTNENPGKTGQNRASVQHDSSDQRISSRGLKTVTATSARLRSLTIPRDHKSPLCAIPYDVVFRTFFPAGSECRRSRRWRWRRQFGTGFRCGFDRSQSGATQH